MDKYCFKLESLPRTPCFMQSSKKLFFIVTVCRNDKQCSAPAAVGAVSSVQRLSVILDELLEGNLFAIIGLNMGGHKNNLLIHAAHEMQLCEKPLVSLILGRVQVFIWFSKTCLCDTWKALCCISAQAIANQMVINRPTMLLQTRVWERA